MWNHHSLPLHGTTGGGRSATSSANMSTNSRNVKSPFFTTTWHYQGGRSATSSANMSSNSRNVKSPFFTTTWHYWGVDLPLHLPIWALTVEMWNCHSWPLEATTGGRSASLRGLVCHLVCPKVLSVSICEMAHLLWLSPSSRNLWNDTFDSRNVKLPFRSTGRSTLGEICQLICQYEL